MGKRKIKNPLRSNGIVDGYTDVSRRSYQSLEDQNEVCRSKCAYETVEEAEMIARRNSSKSGKRIGVYQCNLCGFYHLTSANRE